MPDSGRKRLPMKHMSQFAVYVSLGGDLVVAFAKFGAAAYTGSSAMFSEGVHSLVDSLTSILLLYGLKASKQPSTVDHQLGFGREVFFWNFIVALTILALGAGVALVDGVKQYLNPRPLEGVWMSCTVLGIAFTSEAVSLFAALREARHGKGRWTLLRYLKTSHNATSLTILFGSASGMLGLLAAATGTLAGVAFDRPQYDGFASIVIAVILASTALFLARMSKNLLIGVPAPPNTIESILDITARNPLVLQANGSLSVLLAPDQILVALSVAFRPEGTTSTIENAVAEIDQAIRIAHPEVVLCLLKPQRSESFRALRMRRGW